MLKIVFFLFIFSSLHAAKHNVGVFCGTDEKISDLFKIEAFTLGKALAEGEYELTTGGANTGLMNAVVNGYVTAGNALNLRGILPSIFKNYPVCHPKIPLENVVWTDTIHERLQAFADKCDIVVVLPGGFGTLHELMDFIVPKQWGLNQKKIILFNSDHYWDYLLMQFKIMVEQNALKQKHLDLLDVVTNVEECMGALQKQGDLSHQGLNDHYWEDHKETPPRR